MQSDKNLPLQFWFCRNSGTIFPLYTKTTLIIAENTYYKYIIICDGIMDHLIITPEYILLKKNDWVPANVLAQETNIPEGPKKSFWVPANVLAQETNIPEGPKKSFWVPANVYTECYNAYKYNESDNTLTLIQFLA
jgi:hypothetical protein